MKIERKHDQSVIPVALVSTLGWVLRYFGSLGPAIGYCAVQGMSYVYKPGLAAAVGLTFLNALAVD